jgi:hypothetical protein
MRVRLTLAALSGCALASQAVAAEVNFIACPIYRDADNGRKSGCWLAEDPATGLRYDVSPSASKPDWNFAILVEGKVAEKQDNPCGGTVLDPVRSSVLDDTPCTRHILPAEGYKGRKFILPKRNNDPASVIRPLPKPPFSDRTFRLFFDWNSSFVAYQRDDYIFDQAWSWIRGAPFEKLIITGYAATDAFEVSGQKMGEAPAISLERAEIMRESFIRLGVPADKLIVRDGGNGGIVSDEGSDGLPQQSRRRVDVEVKVGR